MDDDEDATVVRLPDADPALLVRAMLRIEDGHSVRICEHRHGRIEANLVLALVRSGLGGIPFDLVGGSHRQGASTFETGERLPRRSISTPLDPERLS